MSLGKKAFKKGNFFWDLLEIYYSKFENLFFLTSTTGNSDI